MSHIHDIGGFGAAASDYQEYLERMRARRRAVNSSGISKDVPLRTFDSAIDTEREPDRDPEGGAERQGDPDSESESGPRYA